MRTLVLWLGPSLVACGPPAADPGFEPRPLTTLRFTSLGGLIYLPVRIDSAPPTLWNLDSGFEFSIVAARTADGLGLRVRGSAATSQPGGAVETAWIGRRCLTIGSVEFCPDSMARIPLDHLEPLLGQRFPGLLGHDLFERFVVRIDYPARQLTLYDPATFRYQGSGVAVPVWVEAAEPFVTATLFAAGRAHTAKLKVDTGSLDFLGLNGSFVAQTGLFPESWPRVPAPGVAVGGNTENYLSLLDSVTFAGVTIPRPLVGYSKALERNGDAGTLGADLLARFLVIFDYSRHRLLLEPQADVRRATRFDASGLFLVGDPADSTIIRVASVMAGTPGDSAGIRAGDRVIAIGNRSVGDLDLWQARALLQESDSSYGLLIERSHARRTVTLRTRPPL